jgi:hypothetical protein
MVAPLVPFPWNEIIEKPAPTFLRPLVEIVPALLVNASGALQHHATLLPDGVA